MFLDEVMVNLICSFSAGCTEATQKQVIWHHDNNTAADNGLILLPTHGKILFRTDLSSIAKSHRIELKSSVYDGSKHNAHTKRLTEIEIEFTYHR